MSIESLDFDTGARKTIGEIGHAYGIVLVFRGLRTI